MNDKQLLARDLMKNGHNVVILGQGGTGKTFTIRQVLKDIKNRNVALTCFTGIACKQYRGSSFNATTLHRYAGLEDGRHEVTKLVKLLESDERYQKTKDRILNTDILVIDEVSMVSKKVLENVEIICRLLKNKNLIFGGIEVILCGDFYQLPPVKDELYGDNGAFCFSARFFKAYFKHILVLDKVFRQEENTLITAVNELEKGLPSETTNAFMKSLSRPLNVSNTEVIKLFARNIDVDVSNYNYLNSLQGQTYIFQSEDDGDAHYLNKLIAPKHLGLKVHAKVMLLKNLSDEYVNGLVGTVVNINSDCIEVDFEGKICKITRFLFTKYDPVTSKILAKRYQFPLRLANAITIHKSQGMSIPYVEIDCKNAHNPGQLGVAIGRAVSTSGLRILNYKPNIVRRHSDCVNKFYKNISSINIVTDIFDSTCCSLPAEGLNESETSEGKETPYLHVDSSDSESDELLNILSSFHEEHSYSSVSPHVPEYMARDFETSLQDYLGTPDETAARQGCALLLKSAQCISWYKTQHRRVQTIYETSFKAEPGKYQASQFADFYSVFNKYISSSEYLEEMKQFSHIHYGHQLLTSVIFVLQANLFKSESELLTTEKEVLNILPQHESATVDDGKLRYIAGYCIAKCRHRLCSSLRNRLFVPGMDTEINELNEQIQIFDSCIVSASEILSKTKYPHSLEEVHRKQNEREGLTNITDSSFEFFLDLQKAAVQLMSYESLSSERKYLFQYVLRNVLHNTTLLECFVLKCTTSFTSPVSISSDRDEDYIPELLNHMSAFCSDIVALFEMIAKLFITVLFSQFRKDYLRLVKREKGKALRKKVVEKSEKKASQHVTMDSIKNDRSTDKMISHLKLKADALSDSQFYNNYKKAELLLLLKSYNAVISSGTCKKEIGEKLRNILTDEECVKIPNPSCLQEQIRPSEAASPFTVPEPLPGSSAQECTMPTETASTLYRPGTSVHDHLYGTPSSSSMMEFETEEPCTQKQIPAETTLRRSTVKEKGSSKSRSARQLKGKKPAKGKGKGKAKKVQAQIQVDVETNSDRCGVCGSVYKEGEDWICCDVCTLWYHRHCVDLIDDEEWDYFSSEDAVYTCPLCQ